MAEFDDRSHEVPNESENDISHPPAESDDNQKQGGAVAGVVTLFFIIGFVGSLVVGWIVFPKLLYSQKHQPINFNHAVHVEMVENSCESCHYFREDGSFSGIPKNAACIECHEDIQGQTEDERIFVEEYVAKGREVPWLVYSRQPDCVFFSHAAHLKMGEMDCVTCHGHVGESETSRVYEENRITGYSRDIWGRNIAGFKQNSWDRMKMNDCANCHRLNNVNENSVQTQRGGCFQCHK
ncbi:MAG: menaquinone reductase multiheme cytochrome c subunit QrcA [Desulfobacterales bacterium]